MDDKEQALENIRKLMGTDGLIGPAGSTGVDVRGITGMSGEDIRPSRQDLEQALTLFGQGSIPFSSIYEMYGIKQQAKQLTPVDILAKIWGGDNGLKKII